MIEPDKLPVSAIVKSPYYREQLQSYCKRFPDVLRSTGLKGPNDIVRELLLIWEKKSRLSAMKRKKVEALCIAALHKVATEIKEYNAEIAQREAQKST